MTRALINDRQGRCEEPAEEGALLALAERCEKATGPDRELDAEIAVAVSGDNGAFVVSPTECSLFSHIPGWWRSFDDKSHVASAYTASLDAAMSLYVELPERIPSDPRLASAEALRQREREGGMIEEWRTVAGTERRYEVSNLGRVRRDDGLYLSSSVPKQAGEYPAVMLRHSGQRRRVSVHRLVALAFVGLPPFAGAEVRHMDDNHLNPRWDNLQWGSQKENSADRERHGRTPRGPRPNRCGKATGSANGNYRMTPDMKARACRLIDQGYSQRLAAAELGVSQKAVWSALRARAQSGAVS